MKKTSTKPWQLVDWKKKRDLKIKDYCEQCGDKEGPFVLQHTWHPPNHLFLYKEIQRQFINEKFQGGKELVSNLPTGLQQDKYLVNCCPECGHGSLTKRKTIKPVYRCIKCGFLFDEPEKKPNLYIKEIRQIMLNYKKDLSKNYRSEIKKRYEEKRNELYERYMSCDDTVTFCKKCAYLYDVKGLKLCERCKKRYHNKRYEFCFICYKEIFGHEVVDS